MGRLFGRPVNLEEGQVLPTYYVAGGFGGAEPEEEGDEESFGAGGVAVPLGAYIREDGRIRYQPNPIILALALIPFAGMFIGLIKHLATRP